MKHILHVIDTTGPGGAETVFIEVADRIRQCGYSSTVVVRGPGWVLDEVQRRGLNVHVIDAKGTANVEFLRALIQLVRAEHIDLIQSHLLGSNLYCAMVALLTRRPLVATFHGMVDVANTERFLKLKFAIMNVCVTDYVAVSQRLADLFAKQYGLNQSKTRIIYNGVDSQRYQLSRQHTLRKRLGIGEQSFVWGCLGNIRPAKAYDVMTRAVATCRDQGLDLHVVVAGDPKKRLMDELLAQAQALGVADRVHYIGFISDTADYLSNLDGFLLTSSSEGFSISTIEAMAAGLPVVSTRCGGPEEILVNQDTGLLVENGSDTAIAEAMRFIMEQPSEARRLAETAQHVAQTRFDMNTMVAAYLELYQAALS